MKAQASANAENRSKLKAFVIDILHYDIESMQTLLNHLNEREVIGWRKFWPRDFTKEEIIPVLEELINDHFIETLQYNGTTVRLEKVDMRGSVIKDLADSLWFRLADKGYDAWKKWSPPREPNAA